MKNQKNKIFLLFLFFLSTVVFSQTSGVGIGYQAMIYKPSSDTYPGEATSSSPLSNTTICLRFTLLDDTTIMEYQETIKIKTDEFGLVNTVIGTGEQIDGYAANFDGIIWNTIDKTLVVELDVSGLCSAFEEISNKAFSTIPFAYKALMAANVSGVVDIVNGGTGASTVDGARANLGISNVDDTRDLLKPVSIATQVGLDSKIDKVLKVPEIIVTSPTNTLALKGLEVSSSAQNQVVTIDPLTGVLSRSSFLSTVEENVVNYRATEGQLLFTTPSPITTGNKVNVYRNGIHINASVVGSSTIKLEKAASCYLNDEIKIIQFN
ncbi:MAG: hypothetical protein QMB11_07260 [Nonlabens sp.]|uniref:hypothetical protein n=1 Tax=Nonlabens sp. TaxID=1888209 RepID=UPI0035A57907